MPVSNSARASRRLAQAAALAAALLATFALPSKSLAGPIPLKDVEIKQRKETKQIAAPVKRVQTRSLAAGRTRTTALGKPGRIVVTYSQLFIGGKLASEREVSRTKTDPTPTVVEVGTGASTTASRGVTPARSISRSLTSFTEVPSNWRPTFPQTDLQEIWAAERGGSLRGGILRTMESTAYGPFDGAQTGITATGRRARRGMVAVDPRVIPLNSIVFVEGYGWAIAADTGGVIKGNIIDVCIEDSREVRQWGRRQVRVIIFPERITRDLPANRRRR